MNIKTQKKRTHISVFSLKIFFIILAIIAKLKIEINNLLPFMEDGIVPVLKGSYNFIAYNLLPLFLLTII